MIQFYLLAVVFNILSSLFLIYGSDLTSYDEEDSKVPIAGLDDSLIRLLVGLVSGFTGIIKLLSVYDGIPVIGDLIPALACILASFCLLLEYYVCKTSPDNIPEALFNVFIDSRKIIGYVCLAAGILHFVMPGVILF